MKNPYIIVYGVHKNNVTGLLEVNYEAIVHRSNGDTRFRGTAQIGEKIEIEIDPGIA